MRQASDRHSHPEKSERKEERGYWSKASEPPSRANSLRSQSLRVMLWVQCSVLWLPAVVLFSGSSGLAPPSQPTRVAAGPPLLAFASVTLPLESSFILSCFVTFTPGCYCFCWYKILQKHVGFMYDKEIHTISYKDFPQILSG